MKKGPPRPGPCRSSPNRTDITSGSLDRIEESATCKPSVSRVGKMSDHSCNAQALVR